MVRAKQASNSSRRNSSFCILLAANHKRHGGRGGERNKLGFRRRGYLRRMGNEIQLERSYASKLAKLNEVSYIPLCVYPPPPPSVFTNYTPVASSLPPSCHPLICDQPLSFFFFLFPFFRGKSVDGTTAWVSGLLNRYPICSTFFPSKAKLIGRLAIHENWCPLIGDGQQKVPRIYTGTPV